MENTYKALQRAPSDGARAIIAHAFYLVRKPQYWCKGVSKTANVAKNYTSEAYTINGALLSAYYAGSDAKPNDITYRDYEAAVACVASIIRDNVLKMNVKDLLGVIANFNNDSETKHAEVLYTLERAMARIDANLPLA